jgi:hypothetical protein
MKKIILPLLLILAVNINIVAQEMQTMYVAAKQGLNVMSKPNAKAKVLGKIAYEKATYYDRPFVTKLQFDTADGASIEFSIYTLDGQAVIFKSEGV